MAQGLQSSVSYSQTKTDNTWPFFLYLEMSLITCLLSFFFVCDFGTLMMGLCFCMTLFKTALADINEKAFAFPKFWLDWDTVWLYLWAHSKLNIPNRHEWEADVATLTNRSWTLASDSGDVSAILTKASAHWSVPSGLDEDHMSYIIAWKSICSKLIIFQLNFL